MSWAVAGDCVLDAARENGRNVFYIAYDKNGTETFINDAAHWAKAYNLLSSEIEEFIFSDSEDESILAYRIRFASGYEIVALSSKPRNIRSRSGRMVFDEFAFHDNPQELLKAAIAVLMWGKSQIDIISSVNGACPYFEELCNTIAKERGYYVQTTTLDDALQDGLYQRICFVNGWQWTPQGEAEWRSQLIKEYGKDANEELFCIPSKIGDSLFDAASIETYAVGEWQEPIPYHKYLAAIDPNMGGADFWTLLIFDITGKPPYKLVAQYRESNMLPAHCRRQSLKLIDRYTFASKVVLLAIEKENGGTAIAEQFAIDRPKLRVEIVSTNGISKRINTDRIAVALTEGEFTAPKDWVGWSEMANFSKVKREALIGHDDAVMCWSVAWAMLEEAIGALPAKAVAAGSEGRGVEDLIESIF